MPLRLAFLGTPDFAAPTLAALGQHGHDIAAVYTQPPRPAGRGMAERRSAVHELALDLGLEVRTPPTLKDPAEQDRFASLSLDLAVVVAYGLILPGPILAAPRLGCLNLHPSLLPRWRGAAPIQRAIMAGDTETGVMVMRMDEGLDTGAVCLAETVSIGEDATAGDLHDDLARRGAQLMARALDKLEAGKLDCRAQEGEGVTYAAKIDKAESRIDFTRPAREVHNLVRGLSPFPGAWCELVEGGKTLRLKVLRTSCEPGTGAPGTIVDDQLTVACRDGAIRLIEVQPAGKQPMPGGDFQRGARLAPGSRLA